MIQKRFFGFTLSIQIAWKSCLVGGQLIKLANWWGFVAWLGPVYISLEGNRGTQHKNEFAC